MTIKSIRTGWTGISALAGNEQWFSDFESIASVTVGSGGAADVTFSSIPTSYQHLQIRYIARSTAAVNGTPLILKPNNDAGTYRSHGLVGTGSAANSTTTAVDGVLTYFTVPGANATASVFGAGVIDLLDYDNTNKNKTQRQLGGWDNNGSGQIALQSQLWESTTAITSIYLAVEDGNLAQYSHFALYGIRG